MKAILSLMVLIFLSATRVAVAGIDYTDYRHEEWNRSQQKSEKWNLENGKEREREKSYQHQNRETRDPNEKIRDVVHSHPEK